jgi:hypothetical protein
MGKAIRNRTTGFIGLSRAEDKQQVLIGRPDLDPPLVAVGVVAHQLETHAGSPKVQRRLLVCHWHDDLAHSGDHGAPAKNR